MSNGIKSAIVDKLADELLNSIIGKSREEITQLIEQNKRQKILLHTIDKFAKSDIFNVEFKRFTYIQQNTFILQIEDYKIDITLSVKELKVNMLPIIKRCFISDEEDYDLIVDYICVSYIQQARITARIVDILDMEQKNCQNIMIGLDEVKNIILDSQKREVDTKIRKAQLVKSILSNELNHSTSNMMNIYLYFVHKEAVSLPLNEDVTQKGVIRAQSVVIKETLKKMNELIDKKFCMTPIKLNIYNEQAAICEQAISYFQFCEYYFVAQINKEIDKLIKYDHIIPDSLYLMLLEIRNLVESDIFPPVCSQGLEEHIVSKGIMTEVDAMISKLSKLGGALLQLSEYII